MGRKPMQKSALQENKTKELSKGFYKPVDLLEVRNRDERYEYRWINTKKLQDNSCIDPREWEVERKTYSTGVSSDQEKGFLDKAHSLDGTIRVGDLVLAKMSKEKAQARKEHYKQKLRQREEIMNVKRKIQGLSGHVEFNKRRGDQMETI